jgi:hypothetical protein
MKVIGESHLSHNLPDRLLPAKPPEREVEAVRLKGRPRAHIELTRYPYIFIIALFMCYLQNDRGLVEFESCLLVKFFRFLKDWVLLDTFVLIPMVFTIQHGPSQEQLDRHLTETMEEEKKRKKNRKLIVPRRDVPRGSLGKCIVSRFPKSPK